jgi:PAS domain S-box-containing protein
MAILVLFRHVAFRRVHRRLSEREELFELITTHAADMIAIVDIDGNRLYNSPSYQTNVGYSPEELKGSWAFEQIHVEDRERVISAAQEARRSGTGRRMEYRVRHKNGSWRILESTASPIRNQNNEIDKFVIVNRDITDRKEVEQKLEHSASHDSLTDLPNRRSFVECLQRAFDRARKAPNYKFAVLFVDIDAFKFINDSMGHDVGDQMIVEIARRLGRSLRFDDTVSRNARTDSVSDFESHGALARLGGDEFTILVGGIDHPGDALRVANRIQTELSVPVKLTGHEFFPSASIGISVSMTSHSSAADMLRDAGTAMYRAKALGKGRCEIFDSAMHTQAVKCLKVETDLRKALDRHELEVYYQPIVRLQTEEIMGFEALVRWNHPQDGLLLPDSFIPVAEQTGLIHAIDNWVLRESCRAMCSWHAQRASSETPLTLTVNVSAKQLNNAGLPTEIDTVCEDCGITRHSLQLEVTESIAMNDPTKAYLILSQLKHLGVRISIDDFGTGYSSLSRLRQFPADSLKVDRSFVARIGDWNNEDCEIIRLIVMLAHTLHLQVIAEGIETKEQLDFLIALGCDLGQGYLFSRPIDHRRAAKLVEQRTCRPAAFGTAANAAAC